MLIARLLEAVWWGPLRPVAEPVLRRAFGGRRTIFAGRLAGARFRGGLAHTLGIYEPELQRLLPRIVTPGACVLDVGGHLGFTALLASRLAGPTGLVVVFEPDATNRRALEANLRANPWAHIEVSPFAIAKEPGTVRFGSTGGPQSRLNPSAGGALVDSTSLDRWCSARAEVVPTLVKIDVEGAELDVLEGSANVMRRTRPHVLIEVHDEEKAAGTRRFFAALDYAVFELPPKSRRPSYPKHFHATPASTP